MFNLEYVMAICYNHPADVRIQNIVCFVVVIILKLISFSSQSIHCAHINCEERAQLDDASIISSLVKFLSEHVNGVVSVRFYLFSPIVPPK